MGQGTQAELILQHLRERGPITPLEALNLYGCFRLGARVWDLKQTPEGRNIQSEFVELPSGKRVARYWLPQEKGQLSLFQTKSPGGKQVQPGLSCNFLTEAAASNAAGIIA